MTFIRCQIYFLASPLERVRVNLRRKMMKLDFSIGLGQRQGLALTVQVQQAIKLLQMTNLEVNEYGDSKFFC